MQSTSLAVFDWSMAALVWCAAPLIAVAVSVLYYIRSERDAPTLRRIVTSAHGVAIAAIYVAAMSVAMARRFDPQLGVPFSYSLLLPVALIMISAFFYRGRNSIHWLQIPNVACLVWTAFVGGMAVTGKWL
jgi:hypothetical protein